MGCHFLLQMIVPTQGSNPYLFRLLRWQVGSLPLVTPGKPDILTPSHRHTDICVKAQRREYAHLYINIHSSADSYMYENIHDIRTHNDHTTTQRHTSTHI